MRISEVYTSNTIETIEQNKKKTDKVQNIETSLFSNHDILQKIVKYSKQGKK